MYPCIHIGHFLIRAKVDRAGRGRPEKGRRLPTKSPSLRVREDQLLAAVRRFLNLALSKRIELCTPYFLLVALSLLSNIWSVLYSLASKCCTAWHQPWQTLLASLDPLFVLCPNWCRLISDFRFQIHVCIYCTSQAFSLTRWRNRFIDWGT